MRRVREFLHRDDLRYELGPNVSPFGSLHPYPKFAEFAERLTSRPMRRLGNRVRVRGQSQGSES